MERDEVDPTRPGLALTAEVLDDPARVERLAEEWEALEEAAIGPALYAGRSYVMAAWRHLRRPHDRWALVAVREGLAGRLVGVLPLWARREIRSGLPLTVLIHPGILEGERPGVVCSIDPDRVWAAVWQAVKARRSRWHRWDLRELDEGAWPLRWADSGEDRGLSQGWSVRVAPDTAAPWRRAGEPVPPSLCAGPPAGTVLEAVTGAQALGAAWPRYLALEQGMRAAGVPMAGTVQACDGAAELYAGWWPDLARTGRAQLLFLRDASSGEDRAALLRLREPRGASAGRLPWGGGPAWLERHAAWRPGDSASADLAAVWCAAQSDPGGGGGESQRVHLPEPEAKLHQAYGHQRRTFQWSLWNLRSRVGPLIALQSLRRR